jgi:hypothetical protein
MERMKLLVIASAVLLWCGAGAFGQAEEPTRESAPAGEARVGEAGAGHEDAAHGSAHEAGAHDAGPVVPDTRHRWPVPMVGIILISFFAALVIGLVVRAHAPPEMPPTHSHDEPPGASHHHGESGTINPVPADVAKLEQEDAHGHSHGHGHDH